MNKQHQKRTLILFIYSLSSGGAERVMSVLANYWAEKGWDIVLLTIEDKGGDFYSLEKSIQRINLELGGDADSFLAGLKNNYHHIRAIRKVFKQYQPDCIISFMDTTNVLAILAAKGTNIPVIVSERIHPKFYSIGRAWNTLRSWVYPHTNSLVVQTEGIADWGREFVSKEKVDIIPNPVWISDDDLVTEDSSLQLPEGFLIFAMGRLNTQKAFDVLIRAFKQSGLASQQAHLVILGEGEERAALEALIAEEDLGKRVHLVGRISNPHAIIQNADIFVLSSRYEGFPNVLIEAMATGCAVISTDCPSGPADIIENGVNGLLTPVDDIELLASKMKFLFEDDVKRTTLKEQAIKVRITYSLEKVMDQWEAVIDKVIH